MLKVFYYLVKFLCDCEFFITFSSRYIIHWFNKKIIFKIFIFSKFINISILQSIIVWIRLTLIELEYTITLSSAHIIIIHQYKNSSSSQGVHCKTSSSVTSSVSAKTLNHWRRQNVGNRRRYLRKLQRLQCSGSHSGGSQSDGIHIVRLIRSGCCRWCGRHGGHGRCGLWRCRVWLDHGL